MCCLFQNIESLHMHLSLLRKALSRYTRPRVGLLGHIVVPVLQLAGKNALLLKSVSDQVRPPRQSPL